VDPSSHTSTKPQRRAEGKSKEEIHYKDSKRKAPEAVQSTTRKPLKKTRVKSTTHSYDGGGVGQGQGWGSQRFLEKMRAKWANKKDEKEAVHAKELQELDEITEDDELDQLQQDLARIIEDAESEEDNANDAKPRACEGDQVKSKTRQRLREELHEQARASKQRRIGAERTAADCTLEQSAKRPKHEIKGNDAITRLLNIGRLPQGGLKVMTDGNVGMQHRGMNAGTSSSSATYGVGASSSLGVPSVI